MTTREPLTGWTLVHARRRVNPGNPAIAINGSER